MTQTRDPFPAVPVLVELINGEWVPSDAEEWRLECLAREVLGKPLPDRRAWLADFERKRGTAEADRLRAAMTAVHEARKTG